MDKTDLPAKSPESQLETLSPADLKHKFIDELWPMALQAYADLLQPVTDEKVRLQAAQDVKDIALALNKAAGGSHQSLGGGFKFESTLAPEAFLSLLHGMKVLTKGEPTDNEFSTVHAEAEAETSVPWWEVEAE